MKVGGKAYATKGLIETQFASKDPPPTIDNSLDHVTRFESRYFSIYGCILPFVADSYMMSPLTVLASHGGSTVFAQMMFLQAEEASVRPKGISTAQRT